MKTVRVTYSVGNEEIEQTFRTNNDGSCLFVGEGENTQLFCDSGYANRRTMARAIREHAIYRANGGNVSRIKYDWRNFQ